ncbi:hypothetical protein J4466_05060 [Candidatus Pacearchaeota archaeon]|nr:hypothetical protein [Candidatus Pacearchaeota archaeon]
MKAKEILDNLIKYNEITLYDIGHLDGLINSLNGLKAAGNDKDLIFGFYMQIFERLEKNAKFLKGRTEELWSGDKNQRDEYLARFQQAYDETLSAIRHFGTELEMMENEEERNVSNA